MKIIPFGKMPDGREVSAYCMTVGRYSATVTNYGAAIVSFSIDGTDVVLGFDDVSGYIAHTEYMGATVGRFANRIAEGRFTLDGVEYKLTANNGPNHLHGGSCGFDKRLWKAEPAGDNKVRMEYISEHMEEGYPGQLKAVAVFSLSEYGSLKLELSGETDRQTVINMTNHVYFNLDGCKSGHDVLEQIIKINAKRVCTVDADCLATGEIIDVSGTIFELDGKRKLGDMYPFRDEQIKLANGYDHNFVVDGNGVRVMAEAVSDKSGIKLTVSSDQPCVQLYTGNYISEDRIGKGGVRYGKHYGFALEAQNFPNAPNDPNAPSPVLRPGETFRRGICFNLSKI